ncbi:response regulator [Lachnospiraceae bacterium ZAX-1]
MALKLLIADDEYFIRQRIKKTIPWEELGLTLSGEAENGEQALELMANDPADIVLLDIKMPRLTGIEVAKEISLKYPFTNIVILSGYNDFFYAQTAIRYGVKDYLLKPASKEDLTRTLCSCIDSIRQAKSESRSLSKYYHYEKCLAISGVLSNTLSLDDLREMYPEFKQISYTLYVSIYLTGNPEEALHQLVDLMREFGYHCEYAKESDYIFVLQMFFYEKKEIPHIGTFFTDFLNGQTEYCFLYIGKLFPIAEDWTPYYKRSLHRLISRYFTRIPDLLLEQDTTDSNLAFLDLLKIRQTMLSILNSCDESAFFQEIEELFSVIYEKHCEMHLSLVLMELFTIYQNYYQIPERLVISINDFVVDMLEEGYDLESLKAGVIAYGLQCMKKNDAIPSNVMLCKKLARYMEEQYKVADLSVALMADVFQLNPSYLGSIFKSVYNMSILQYLTHLRLEAAKNLLVENRLKVFEVAEAVGYSDVFYFSKRFKKAYGYSPKDYQQTAVHES